jgi:hypothetical protein
LPDACQDHPAIFARIGGDFLQRSL